MPRCPGFPPSNGRDSCLSIACNYFLLSYFETTWIGQPAGGRRLAPTFPHQMWNVSDRASTGSTRTTNSLEAFQRTFNALVSCQHPTVWKLLLALEKQQNLTKDTLIRIQRRDSFRVSAKETKRNERLSTLINNYTTATADNLLRGVAYNYMLMDNLFVYDNNILTKTQKLGRIDRG